MKKLSFLFLILLTTSGCAVLELENNTADVTKKTNTPQPEKIRNLSFNDFSTSAIMAININEKPAGTAENLGSIPKIQTHPQQFATHSPSIQILKDLPHIYPSLPSQQAITNDTESPTPIKPLSHFVTKNVFKTYNFDPEVSSPSLPITGTLRYGNANTNCLIYVEENHSNFLYLNTNGTITKLEVDWNTIGQEYDNVIYKKMSTNFGPHFDIDNNKQLVIFFYSFDQTLEFNGSSFVVGYFWPNDIDPLPGAYTNNTDMLYMNTLSFGLDVTYDTLVHEYQHIINFSQRINPELNPSGKSYSQQETWIDEGLSEAAAHLVYDAIDDHVALIKDDTSIRNGLPLISWEGTAQDYALSYTFMEYLRLQSTNGSSIFKAIILEEDPGAAGIYNVMKTENTAFTSFQDILISYHLANLMNLENSIYGYQSERTTFSFGTLSAPSSTVTTLKPGGAVYYYPTETNLTKFVPENTDDNIWYYRINP